MRRKQVLVAGLVILTVCVGIVTGCRHHRTPEEKMDRVIDYITDDMELSNAQLELLDKLKKDLISRFVEIKGVRQAAHAVIMAQLRNDVMDQDAVMTAIDDVRSEVDILIAAIVSGVADFHQTLTPDQKKQLVERLESLRKLHGCGQ